MTEIEKLIKIEGYIAALIKRITDEISEEIVKKPMEGITPLGGSCFTIKLSSVQKNGFILSPEYYSPYKQAEYVGEYLSGAKTAVEFISRIERMITDRKIKRTGNDVVRLNDQTVAILEKYGEYLNQTT